LCLGGPSAGHSGFNEVYFSIMKLKVLSMLIFFFLPAITYSQVFISGDISVNLKDITYEVDGNLSAPTIRNISASTDTRKSLLGSPKNWLMGPATGVPTIIGWRIERFWRDRPMIKPDWIVGADLGATVPGVRISIEKQLSHSSFYSGISSRFIFVPTAGQKGDNTAFSLGIPLSFRYGKTKYLHTTLSIEAFTGVLLKEWRILPTLQISFLGLI